MSEVIIKKHLRFPIRTKDHRERQNFLAAVKDVLDAGDETFSRKTVEVLMGELTLAQEFYDKAMAQDRWVQLPPEETRRLAKFLERPNRSFGGQPRLSVNAVEGGGLLIRIAPWRYEQ